jgi:hypothetical protein
MKALSDVQPIFSVSHIFEDWPTNIIDYEAERLCAWTSRRFTAHVHICGASLNPVTMAALGRALWQGEVMVLCLVPWTV